MSDVADYLAQTKSLPDDAVLGRVVLYTVHNEFVNRNDIIDWIDELKLNSKFVPDETRAVDAFKLATSNIDATEYPRDDGTTGIMLNRPVVTTQEQVFRHVVREIRNERRRMLRYDTAIEAVFYKATKVNGRVKHGTERIRLTRLSDGLDATELADVDKVIQEINDRYKMHANGLSHQKIRAMIRDYLKYLNAIEIKGGVYFVHKNRTDELNRLVELARRCGAHMYQIPLVDLDSERDMVIEAFQREAEESLTDLVRRIAKVKSTRQKVTPEAYAKLKTEYDRVIDQALEYQRTLRVTQTRTSTAAELALDSLTDLMHTMLGDA